MSDTDYQLIILGGGPAGLTAGLYAARDRLQGDLVQLDLQGALSPGEYADFQDYLGRLGIRIARQCREIVQRYPDIDVEELPCPADGGMSSLPVDADTERTPKEQVAELDASLAAGLSDSRRERCALCACRNRVRGRHLHVLRPDGRQVSRRRNVGQSLEPGFSGQQRSVRDL